MKHRDFKEDIHELVQYGKVEEARLAIRRFLASNSYPAEVAANTVEGRRLLLGTQYFNSVGANPFALELARRVLPTDSEHSWLLGNIYQSNWDSDRALSYVLKMEEMTSDLSSKADRLRLILKSSALAGLGRFDEAISNLEHLRSVSPELDLRSRIELNWGSCLAQVGRNYEALAMLSHVENEFMLPDDSVEFAILCKWLGYLHCRNGNFEGGKQYFDRAHKILFTPSYRLEPWLELIKLKSSVLPLPDELIQRIIHYPGHSRHAQAFFGRKVPCWFGSEAAPLRIYLESNEVFAESSFHIGVSKELRLLAYLRIAGDWGINSIRLQSVMWPDEVFSYPHLEDRLKKLVQRLRTKYRVDVRMDGGLLRIGPGSVDQIAVLSAGGKIPSLLQDRPVVRNVDVETYYGVSRAQAANYLTKWIDRAVLTKRGAGKNTQYLVTDSTL